MSTNLCCVYQEEFNSKLGKTLKFRDELKLRIVDTPDTFNILWYTFDGKEEWNSKYGRDKTNQEIYEHYLLWLNQNTFKGDHWGKKYIKYHQEECDKFFKKYGIDNVEWFGL